FRSTVSSTGRLTQSEQNSTVSKSLLLRCLWSRLSCACSRFRSCSRKSATSFGTDTCWPLFLTSHKECGFINQTEERRWRMDRFNVAVEVVQNAGNILRQCSLENAEICQKTGHQDLVTRWDRRIEQ